MLQFALRATGPQRIKERRGVSSAERMARLRQRQNAEGLSTITLVVPTEAVAAFRRQAEQARRAMRGAREAPMRESLPESDAGKTALVAKWAAISGLKLNPHDMKLGEILARTIAHEIVLAGWPVGHVLGNEGELMVRYGISRSVLREALRILEAWTVIGVRRGVGGGAVVAAIDPDRAMYAIGLHVEYFRGTLADVEAVRRPLELLALDRVCSATSGKARLELDQQAQAERRLSAPVRASDLQAFHVLLARLSGNPVLGLYLQGALRLSRFHSRFPELRSTVSGVVETVIEAHGRIAQAVVEGDPVRAHREMSAYLSIDPDLRV